MNINRSQLLIVLRKC